MDAPASDPAPRARTATAKGFTRVRSVAKINGSGEAGSGAVSVSKPDGEESRRVTLTFGDQSASCYELDFCYDQHQGNSVVFKREVLPLVSRVLEGFNATVIVTGANGTGKSHLIQDDEDEPGLVTLAVSEMVQMAEKDDKSTFVSLYEATPDRVFDILSSSRQEVIIRRDAQGNIQLKGLCQVAVNSVLEFQKLLSDAVRKSKPNQNMLNESPRKNHVGLMIYVLSPTKRLIGKMNFVVLAGYEDIRRRSVDGSTSCEITKINRSILALHHVLQSISANEAHVPYRETKLTHMLQDSLGGTSRVLMITCLDQSVCQDSIRMISLASRSCQNSGVPISMRKHSRVVSSSQNSAKGGSSFMKKTDNISRQNFVKAAPSSMKIPVNIARSTFDSRKGRGIGSAATTSKKQIISGIHSAKEALNVSSVLKARKVFGKANVCNSEKISSQKRSLDIIPVTESLFEEQVSCLASSLDIIPFTESLFNDPGKLCSGAVTDEVTLEDQHPLLKSLEDADPLSGVDAYPSTDAKPVEITPLNKVVALNEGVNLTGVTHSKSSQIEEGNKIETENNGVLLYSGGSPPLSSKLQEISNTLKNLYNSTPSYAKAVTKIDLSFPIEVSTEFVEPRTPDQCARPHDSLEIVSFLSPRQAFSARSTRAKESLVRGYLNILNTASKEELKKLKGIGDKRATYIVEMRERSPEPFKELDDLKSIGLSGKQIKNMVKSEMAIVNGRAIVTFNFILQLDDLKSIGLSGKQIKNMVKSEMAEIFN